MTNENVMIGGIGMIGGDLLIRSGHGSACRT